MEMPANITASRCRFFPAPLFARMHKWQAPLCLPFDTVSGSSVPMGLDVLSFHSLIEDRFIVSEGFLAVYLHSLTNLQIFF